MENFLWLIIIKRFFALLAAVLISFVGLSFTQIQRKKFPLLRLTNGRKPIFFLAIIICLVLHFGIGWYLSHLEKQLAREQIDKIQLRIQAKINSNNFSAFNNDTKVRDELLTGTRLKWEHFNGQDKGKGYPFYVHYLMKKENIRNKIKKYIFNDWHLDFNCKSKDNKSYIEPDTISGYKNIDNISLLSTDFENGIYYYVITMEYILNIDDAGFRLLKGFDGAKFSITLKAPKDKKLKIGFIHLHLIGPDKHFLRDAYFKVEVAEPPSFGHHAICAEVDVPKTFSEDYRKTHN